MATSGFLNIQTSGNNSPQVVRDEFEAEVLVSVMDSDWDMKFLEKIADRRAGLLLRGKFGQGVVQQLAERLPGSRFMPRRFHQGNDDGAQNGPARHADPGVLSQVRRAGGQTRFAVAGGRGQGA
jgi:hypothetical protein